MEKDTRGRFIKGWKNNIWSRKHNKCISCGTNKIKHGGYGLCRKCFQKSPTYMASIKKYRSSDKWKKQKKAYDLRVRLEAIRHYGKGKIECNCCGEKDYRFLSFDHINGGGNKHILSIKGYRLGQWLRKNKYPKGFQILCHNCNMSKGIYGTCPHKLKDNIDFGGNLLTIVD